MTLEPPQLRWNAEARLLSEVRGMPRIRPQCAPLRTLSVSVQLRTTNRARRDYQVIDKQLDAVRVGRRLCLDHDHRDRLLRSSGEALARKHLLSVDAQLDAPILIQDVEGELHAHPCVAG